MGNANVLFISQVANLEYRIESLNPQFPPQLLMFLIQKALGFRVNCQKLYRLWIDFMLPAQPRHGSDRH
jgi:hypothetical protein